MSDLSGRARHLWDVVEPVAGSVYFAPEAHAAYERLGFAGVEGTPDGIHFPDPVAYFASRGACLGALNGEVIAAAFGVFKRDLVVPLVEQARHVCDDTAAIVAARQEGATESLRRLLGDVPNAIARATELLQRAASAAPGEGRHLFSGLQSLGYPGTPIGDFWRAADLVREHRGDSHIAAWIGAGLDACEIGLITDLWRGQPLKSWVRTRGWSDDDLDAGVERLRSRGLIDKASDAITASGWQLREDIDVATDRMEERVIAALGDEIHELFSLMEPLAEKIVSGRGYPGAVTWPSPPL